MGSTVRNVAIKTLHLSAVPLLMVTLTLFSRFVDTERLTAVLTAEVSQLLPPHQARSVVDNALAFAQAPEVSGLLGLGSLLVFSTLAFRTLQRAIDIIFGHRGGPARRPLWSSVLISIAYVVAIGVASSLQALALVSIDDLLPGFGLHLPRTTYWLSFAGLVVIVSSIYLVMPVAKVSIRAALLAGVWVAVAWALMQQALLYYFETLSPVNWIFGSMATIIAVLISFELLAAFVLLGAQAVAVADRDR
jgi:YihY family inner membrane protein